MTIDTSGFVKNKPQIDTSRFTRTPQIDTSGFTRTPQVVPQTLQSSGRSRMAEIKNSFNQEVPQVPQVPQVTTQPELVKGGVFGEDYAVRQLERNGVPQDGFFKSLVKAPKKLATGIASGVKGGIEGLGNIPERIVERADLQSENIDRYTEGGQDPISTAVQIVGESFGLIGDIGFDVIGGIVKGLDKAAGSGGQEALMEIAQTEKGQQGLLALQEGMEAFEKFKAENPVIGNNIEAVGNIITTSAGGTATKGVTKFTAQGMLTTGEKTLDATKKVNQYMSNIEKVISKQLNEKKAKLSTRKNDKIIQKRVKKLSDIESANAPLRKYVSAQQAKGIDVKESLASTDVLRGSVDNNGIIRTIEPDGAIQQYRDFLEPQENIVTQILEAEGKTISLNDLEKNMIDALNKSNIKGSTKTTALKRIKSEIDGLALDSVDGQIPLSIVQDAKIQKYKSINYLNKESANSDKLVAKTLKEAVENNSEGAIKAINKELAGHYATIGFLEKLDGRRVAGGRLGKYFAQTVGAIAGSHFGAVGVIAGAEIGSFAQGGIMGSTFKKGIGRALEETPAIKGARDGLDQLNKSGNLNKTQTTSKMIDKIDINTSVPQKPSQKQVFQKKVELLQGSRKVYKEASQKWRETFGKKFPYSEDDFIKTFTKGANLDDVKGFTTVREQQFKAQLDKKINNEMGKILGKMEQLYVPLEVDSIATKSGILKLAREKGFKGKSAKQAFEFIENNDAAFFESQLDDVARSLGVSHEEALNMIKKEFNSKLGSVKNSGAVQK